jgi:hypothetical protein
MPQPPSLLTLFPAANNNPHTALYMSYPDSKVTYRISEDDGEFFYHRALWVDVDKDGLADLVTTRTNFVVPPFNPSIAQTVWFKNPGQNLENTADVADFRFWNASMIDDGAVPGGCDVNMVFADLDGDGQDEIVCTHFFDHRYVLIYMSSYELVREVW